MTPQNERGVGLAELMVALAIGTIVCLLAFTLLASVRTSESALSEAARVDDAGRFAIAAIERAARQGGLSDWSRIDEGEGGAAPAVVGLDAASLSSEGDALNEPRPAAVNGSDILALRFAGAADGSVTGCAGFAVTGGEQGWSIFYVGLNGRGEPELRCKYRGSKQWAADAVVGGVDSFQVLYGFDTDTPPDGVANRYLNATDIIAMDSGLPPEGMTDSERARNRLGKSSWKRVVSIQVALLLHAARGRVPSGPSLYDLFGEAYSAAAGASDVGTRVRASDLVAGVRERDRRLFTSTIALRNRERLP